MIIKLSKKKSVKISEFIYLNFDEHSLEEDERENQIFCRRMKFQNTSKFEA